MQKSIQMVPVNFKHYQVDTPRPAGKKLLCSLCKKVRKKTEMANLSRINRIEYEDNETSSSLEDSSDDEIEQGWVGEEADFQ